MHDSRRWRLLCYDIRDPKRYRHAHRLIKGYAEPVQYSIFRARLDDRQTAQLRWELDQILDVEDSLLIIDLCAGCAGRVVSDEDTWREAPPTFSIVIARPLPRLRRPS